MAVLSGKSAVSNHADPVALGKGYTFQVLECVEKTAQSGNTGFECKLEVIGAPDQSQVGKEMLYQSFYARKLWLLIAACCLTNKATGEVFTPESLKALDAANEAGTDPGQFEFDAGEAEGRTFSGDVVMGRKNSKGKQYPEVGFEITPPVEALNDAMA
jgi:hypothetical protein